MLTQELLKERLSYDPGTGQFRARVKRKCLNIGDIAGSPSSKGYWRIKIDNREYSAHRLAWLYVHGRWPAKHLDHENRSRSDNRIGNLREAGFVENGQNRKLNRNNTSGFHGVCFDKRSAKRQASIGAGGKTVYLGQFATPEAAAEAHIKAKAELHTFQPTLKETP